MAPSAPPTLPPFEVRLAAPDVGNWVEGNTGITGFTTRTSRRPGPHVVLLALAHGNEIAGAVALDRLLAADLAPTRGRLFPRHNGRFSPPSADDQSRPGT